jgi:hypothetical protein
MTLWFGVAGTGSFLHWLYWICAIAPTLRYLYRFSWELSESSLHTGFCYASLWATLQSISKITFLFASNFTYFGDTGSIWLRDLGN